VVDGFKILNTIHQTLTQNFNFSLTFFMSSLTVRRLKPRYICTINLKLKIMKKLTVCIAAFALIALANQATAQNHVAKEVSKTVNVEEENGVKTLTINTVEDGNSKTEVYTGAEADAKLAELEKEESGTTKIMEIDPDGEKRLKVEQKVIKKTSK
jgi:ribonucleotide reductase alpha subunit